MVWFKRTSALTPANPVKFYKAGFKENINIVLTIEAADTEFEFFCLGLDEQKNWIDSYISCSTHQMSSDEAIQHESNTCIKINPKKVLDSVHKLVLLTAITNDGAVIEWGKSRAQIKTENHSWEWTFHGSQFGVVKILSLFTLTRLPKSEWSVQVESKGVSGSLDDLIQGLTSTTQPEEIVPTAAPVSLIKDDLVHDPQAQLKKIELMAPYLIEYYHTAQLVLNKNKNVLPSRCVLVLDRTTYAKALYENGHIQTLIELMMGLSAQWHTWAQVEIFIVSDSTHYAGTVRLSNAKNAIKKWEGTYSFHNKRAQFGRAIEVVRRNIYPENNGEEVKQLCAAEAPTMVLWLMGHGIDDVRVSEWQIRWASREPIFWCFMAVTGQRYRLKSAQTIEQQGGIGGDFVFLDHLHKIEDCALRNTSYLTVSNSGGYSSQELYEVILDDYSVWMNDAKQKGLIRKS